ncbi:MAG: hybrid sensor histidine kinase/response regulator [Candidatus Omnitrophica bacterium]|nr:hybrid sensor histidine kinase/response regulator [Candidatus Omnitrophota bacterium]
MAASMSLDVLVVDDEPKIRKLLEQMLRDSGCAVRTAADGVEGLELFTCKPADLVLTDIKMPKLSGVELLEQLKQLDPLVNVAVITGNASLEGAVDVMRDGACDFLSKPFELTQVQAIVYRCQQRVRLRQQVRSAQEGRLKLEELNRRLTELSELKSFFLMTLSHEVNTPLCLMSEWIRLLADGTLGPLSEDQQRGTKTLLEAYERLHRLLQQMIDLTQGHTILLRRQPVAAQAMVQEALARLTEQVAQRAIPVEVSLPAVPLMVEADRQRIEAAVGFVLENAIRFNRQGGRVTITMEGSPQAVSIRIQDTGVGIAPEDIERVFEPFYQTDRRMNRTYDGAGIGLTLAKRYVELHGGSISLTSELGAGTTVTLSLPRPPSA